MSTLRPRGRGWRAAAGGLRPWRTREEEPPWRGLPGLGPGIFPNSLTWGVCGPPGTGVGTLEMDLDKGGPQQAARRESPAGPRRCVLLQV